MITKRQACVSAMDSFAKSEGVKVEDITEADILKSSTLAVAMEYLGLLSSQDMKAYASERGGCVMSYFPKDIGDGKFDKEPSILTFRELLEMLPE